MNKPVVARVARSVCPHDCPSTCALDVEIVDAHTIGRVRGAKDDPSTWPDISAPGENIVGACRAYQPICSSGLKPQNGPGLLDVGSYNTLSGTSMAAPQITGIVALLFQINPTATPAEIEAALKSTAFHYSDGAPYQKVGGYSTSFDKGTGLVDVMAAAQTLGAHTP